MTEFAFQLKQAKKEAVPALIGLWGKSGSGKTYSALLLARGLVGAKGKIAVIDTENKRSLFYADKAGGWMHLDLQPPFTPEKYSAAFKFCEENGADVIVVDSMSHVWEDVLEQADNATTSSGKPMQGLAKWKAPKIAHKRMMNDLIRSPIPVIFCVRAKEASRQVGAGKDMQIVQLGWQPISEKNFIFEMTVDLHMTQNGAYDLATSKTVPEALRSIIKPNGVVNEAMGGGIAEWAGTGIAVDPEFIKLKREGNDAALQGVEVYTKWGKTLSAPQRESVKNFLAEWLANAKTVDLQKQPEGETK